MEPRKGLRFLHARVLDATKKPMLYEVTKIARGTVYYRPIDGGSPDCCDIDSFSRYARPINDR